MDKRTEVTVALTQKVFLDHENRQQIIQVAEARTFLEMPLLAVASIVVSAGLLRFNFVLILSGCLIGLTSWEYLHRLKRDFLSILLGDRKPTEDDWRSLREHHWEMCQLWIVFLFPQLTFGYCRLYGKWPVTVIAIYLAVNVLVTGLLLLNLAYFKLRCHQELDRLSIYVILATAIVCALV